MTNYRNFFGLQKKAFAQDIKVQDLFPMPAMSAALERIRYVLEGGAVTVVTAEVGAGKSTSLRYACAQVHPSKYRILPVVASNGTIMEIYRQIALAAQCGDQVSFDYQCDQNHPGTASGDRTQKGTAGDRYR
ncbi:MAG TPA: ATP-binding protein [Dissulfurispiraceae bacterium]|nr:ATP-binding protein [Dissulfurispiraceae bacterium]